MHKIEDRNLVISHSQLGHTLFCEEERKKGFGARRGKVGHMGAGYLFVET